MNILAAVGFTISVFLFWALLVCWLLFWKAWAVWVAAQQKSKIWFFVLLFVNTAGILEILYIFHFYKARRVDGKTVFDENAERADFFGIEKYFSAKKKKSENVRDAEVVEDSPEDLG